MKSGGRASATVIRAIVRLDHADVSRMEENLQQQEIVRDLAIAKMRKCASCEPAPREENLREHVSASEEKLLIIDVVSSRKCY